MAESGDFKVVEGPGWTRFREVLGIVDKIFIKIARTGLVFLIAGEITYVRLTKYIGSEKRTYFDKDLVREWRDKLNNILLSMSPLVPNLSTITLVAYFYLIIWFFYYDYYEKLITRTFDSKMDCIVNYLRYPEQSKQLIRKSLDEILRQILASNVNYSAKLARIQLKYNSSKKKISFDSNYGQNQESINQINPMGCLVGASQDPSDSMVKPLYQGTRLDPNLDGKVRIYSRLKYKLYQPESSTPLDEVELGKASDELVSGLLYPRKLLDLGPNPELDMKILSREHHYLTHLLNDDKTDIWPMNRNMEWVSKFRQMYLTLHVFTYISIFSLIIMNVNLTLSSASLFAKRNGIVRNRRLRHLIVHVALYLQINRAINLFVDPLVCYFMITLDVVKLNRSVREKISQFRFKACQLRLLRSATSIPDQAARMDQLKMECERLSISAYVSFRHMINLYREVKPMSKGICNPLVGLMIGMWLLTISFNSEIHREEYPAIIGLAVSCVTGFHLTAGYCAFFEVEIIQTIDMLWSLVQCSIQPEEAAKGIENSQSSFTELKQGETKSNNKLFEDSNNENMGGYRTRYERDLRKVPCASRDPIMSAHMLLLWNRLITSDQLRSMFKILALDLIQLDYQGILQFDFWLVSLLMLSSVYARPAH